jgi:23S rRNA pseudouridine2605 synthase/23S rRNA pseudouridine2604 synthase
MDRVAFDGRPVAMMTDHLYIALHKPPGYVSSCRHPGEKLVTSLVDIPERLFPVGRLDKDSTGLILLTNDGPIHHHLSHPSFDHEKVYTVTADRALSHGELGKLARGVPLKEGKTRPARVKRFGARRFQIVLQEGRNRQIRRMVRFLGARVITLHRTRVAHIHLGDLAPGKWRHLTSEERKKLLAELKSAHL